MLCLAYWCILTGLQWRLELVQTAAHERSFMCLRIFYTIEMIPMCVTVHQYQICVYLLICLFISGSFHANSTSGPQVTTSDFCNFWHMCRPMSDEMICKISAPNTHLFQNTAKFYGRGVSRCCRPSPFFGIFECKYLSCYTM